MISMLYRRAAGAIVAGLVLIAGCTGGSGPAAVIWFVSDTNPRTSVDLNGGDIILVIGQGFDSVVIARVRFGDNIAFNVSKLSDTQIQVTTPPAPNAITGPVTVTVESLENGQRQLPSGYTYVDVASPPNPQLITPVNFSATGAENFTIQGTNLGLPGGSQQVNFVGIGTVTAQVSLDGQFLTGPAPVSVGAPAQVPITVRVEPAGGNPVDVPTTVNFVWAPPAAIPLGFQTSANASQPVRLADGFAALCTSGTDITWGNGNDTIVIVSGPPNTIGTISLGGQSLSAANSIPTVMDGNTFAVYSLGPDGAPASPDDLILHISAAQSGTPVVTPVSCPFMNSAPLVAIATNRIATTGANPLPGGDGVPGTADDEIVIATFTGTLASIVTRPFAGPMDPTGGANAWSQPISLDGENVYVPTVGTDGVPMTADDFLSRVQVSQLPAGGFLAVNAPFLAGRPIAFGSTRLAAPAGVGGAAGGVNDVLTVFDDTGTAINRILHALNTRTIVGAPRPFTPFGANGIAVAQAGVDTLFGSGDERVRVYTDPFTNTFNDIQTVGLPVMSPLGGGAMIFWDSSFAAFFIDVLATFNPPSPFFPSPPWNMGFAPLADATRAFAVDAGMDALPDTGDESLIVQQSRTIFNGVNGSVLPLATSLASRLTGQLPFVPVGPGWGLIQSAGSNGTFGDADDQLVLARY